MAKTFSVRPRGTVVPYPGAPTGLVLAPVISSSITLTWNPVATATFYVVRRFGAIIANNVVPTNYTDSGLPSSTLETYTVSAVNTFGEGPQSAPASATTSASSLAITTTSPLTAGTQGSAYSFTMAASGGIPPYTWSKTSSTGTNTPVISSAGVITMTPATAETDTITVKVTDSLLATASGTFSITVNASGATVPNILALPLNTTIGPDWSTFPGTGWSPSFVGGTNAPYSDSTTGVQMRRCTDGVWPPTATYNNFPYGTPGGYAGQPFDPLGGANKNQYHVFFTTLSNPSGAGTTTGAFTMDYVLGQGIDRSTYQAVPLINSNAAGKLGFCWSTRAGEQHIAYIFDTNTPASLHRWNAKTNAFETRGPFVGAQASLALPGTANVGYATINWAGTHIQFLSPFSGPTLVCVVDLDAGTLYTKAAGGINEAKFCKGATPVVCYDFGGGGVKFWFPLSGNLTALVNTVSTATHSNATAATYCIFDDGSSSIPLHTFTTGTDPGSDGGAWNGVHTVLYNAGGGTQTHDTDHHPQQGWIQPGGPEYYFIGVSATQSGRGNKTSANGWSIDSGSVYKTAVSYAAAYGTDSNGVRGVNYLPSATLYSGAPTLAANRGAMTAGTWFFSAGTCYVWMNDSSNPTGKVRLIGMDTLSDSLGYVALDGSGRYRLCNSWRNSNTYGYDGDIYPNVSYDGKVVFYGCDFGQEYGAGGGRVDIVAVEVPVH